MGRVGRTSALALVLATATWGAGPIPPPPPPGTYVVDRADLLPASVEEEIQARVEDAALLRGRPIVVVTVERWRDFGLPSVEGLARRWIGEWGIGGRGEESAGILLLLAVEDRKARIQLGPGWPRKWDVHCSWIMEERIVPRFREGDYETGVLAGVEELRAMAELGPAASPPSDLLEVLTAPFRRHSTLPRWGFLVSLALGLLAFLAAGALPQARGVLLGLAFGLFTLALFTYVGIVVLAVAITALMGRHRGTGSYRRGYSGGYSGGGGSFGGRVSGGGATGSW